VSGCEQEQDEVDRPVLPMITILASMPWSSYLEARYGSWREYWAMGRRRREKERLEVNRAEPEPRWKWTASRISNVGTDGPVLPYMAGALATSPDNDISLIRLGD
jgi:hypothetical protein